MIGMFAVGLFLAATFLGIQGEDASRVLFVGVIAFLVHLLVEDDEYTNGR